MSKMKEEYFNEMWNLQLPAWLQNPRLVHFVEKNHNCNSYQALIVTRDDYVFKIKKIENLKMDVLCGKKIKPLPVLPSYTLRH